MGRTCECAQEGQKGYKGKKDKKKGDTVNKPEDMTKIRESLAQRKSLGGGWLIVGGESGRVQIADDEEGKHSEPRKSNNDILT